MTDSGTCIPGAEKAAEGVLRESGRRLRVSEDPGEELENRGGGPDFVKYESTETSRRVAEEPSRVRSEGGLELSMESPAVCMGSSPIRGSVSIRLGRRTRLQSHSGAEVLQGVQP